MANTRQIKGATPGTDTAGHAVTVPPGRYLVLARSDERATLDVPELGAVTVHLTSKGNA
jgi:hypothetical protein